VLSPIRDGLFELANAIFEGDFQKAESIIKDFVDAIASIDFSQAFEDITDAVDGIITKIQESFSGAQARGIVEEFIGLFTGFASFAATKLAGFVRDIISELQGTNTDNVLAEFLVNGLSALAQFSTQATTAIGNFLGGLDYDRLINDVVNGLVTSSETLRIGIVDLIRSINWNKVSSAVIEEFTPSLGEALQAAFVESVKLILFPTRLFAELLAEGAREAAEVAKNALDPSNSQTVETQTDPVDRGTDPGMQPTTSQDNTTRISIDGFEVDKRIGRYGQGNVANRGGTTGL
jgi:hypothetical protein